jgi:hypothetical protein
MRAVFVMGMWNLGIQLLNSVLHSVEMDSSDFLKSVMTGILYLGMDVQATAPIRNSFCVMGSQVHVTSLSKLTVNLYQLGKKDAMGLLFQ